MCYILLRFYFYIVCANASYLMHDYGISITMTYNNIIIINETITGNIQLQIEICNLVLYFNKYIFFS